MQYKGKIVNKTVRNLNNYVKQHVTHTYHLRPMIHFLKQKNLQNLIGVEIGTLQALNALSILHHLNIKHLYLIDPYILYDDGINTYKNRDIDFDIAQKNMLSFKDKVTFIKKTSIDAVNDIPNDIDFVYIDGNHSYRYVKYDIENYYPKVKKGGTIGGHDFRADCSGLCRAVLEFVDNNKLELNGWKTDWWIEKNI